LANVSGFIAFLIEKPNVMKPLLHITLAGMLVLTLASCSTAYKSTQTPDDLYYSPAASEDAVYTETSSNKRNTYLSNNDENRYLRMKVRSRARWSCIDDFDYWHDSRFDFSTAATNRFDIWTRQGWCGCNHWYINPYVYYNGWGGNNPFITVATFRNPRLGTTTASNIRAFTNQTFSNTNYNFKTQPASFSTLVRRVVTPSNSNGQSSSFDRPVRSFSSGTTTSSSAGGRSGGFSSSGSSAGGARGGRN
jgi:uncharacterized membrane protein YgcG